MANRIIGMIFWLGVAALLAATGIRFGYPAKDQYVSYLLYAGLVCLLIYVLGQWRDIVKSFSSRQARYGSLTGVERARRPRRFSSRSTTSARARTSAGI